MTWTTWLIGSAIAFLPGAYLLRAGKLKAVRFYLLACAALVVAWVFNVGAFFGADYAAWPKALLAILAPATVTLAVWGAQRDRERVMGTTREERDALATPAILYGASHHGSDTGDTGDPGAGNMGGGE